jgi:hypothetical protein
VALTVLRLIDGPLMDPAARREHVVAAMAGDLIAYDAFRVEADAIRALMAREYSPFDVLRFVDDARQVAIQEIYATGGGISGFVRGRVK